MTIPEIVESTGFPVIDVDVLISGAGPAGASLACFLASHGRFKYSYIPSCFVGNVSDWPIQWFPMMSTFDQSGRI